MKAFEFIPQSFSLKTDGKALDDYLISSNVKNLSYVSNETQHGLPREGHCPHQAALKTAKDMPDE